MTRLRATLNRRLCFACGAEAGRDDVVCPNCGEPLRPLMPPAGVPVKVGRHRSDGASAEGGAAGGT